MIAIDIQPGGHTILDWIDYWHSKDGGDVTWALDADPFVARLFRVITLGQTVVIDRDGNVVYNGLPPRYEQLKQLLETAI